MQKYLKLILFYLIAISSFQSSSETFTSHCRDYLPDLFFDGSTCVGPVPELVSDIVSELGHNIKWLKVPWIRTIEDAKHGNVDLLIRHSMTQERKIFLLPIPYGYYTRTLSFYKSPMFKSEISSYKDLEVVNVGAIRGNFYSPRFSTLNSNELIFVGKNKQLLRMLEKGRIDVVVTSESHSIMLFNDRFEKVTFEDTFDNPLYVSIPKNSKASKFYKDIANLTLEYRKNGKIDQYFERHGLPVPEQIYE